MCSINEYMRPSIVKNQPPELQRRAKKKKKKKKMVNDSSLRLRLPAQPSRELVRAEKMSLLHDKAERGMRSRPSIDQIN